MTRDLHMFNPIQERIPLPLKFSACGTRRAPKLIPPKSCDIYEANKKIESIAQKLGQWAPIQNLNLMADLAERHIFKKIQEARGKLP